MDEGIENPFKLDHRIPDGQEREIKFQSNVRARVNILGLSYMKVTHQSSQTPFLLYDLYTQGRSGFSLLSSSASLHLRTAPHIHCVLNMISFHLHQHFHFTELRQRQVKELTQGHRAGKWLNLSLNTHQPESRAV